MSVIDDLLNDDDDELGHHRRKKTSDNQKNTAAQARIKKRILVFNSLIKRIKKEFMSEKKSGLMTRKVHILARCYRSMKKV